MVTAVRTMNAMRKATEVGKMAVNNNGYKKIKTTVDNVIKTTMDKVIKTTMDNVIKTTMDMLII